MEWQGFDDCILPNCVYALHDYSVSDHTTHTCYNLGQSGNDWGCRGHKLIASIQGMGFPTGEQFEGTDAQKDLLEKQFLRKAEFMMKNKVPIWK